MHTEPIIGPIHIIPPSLAVISGPPIGYKPGITLSFIPYRVYFLS
jgi:hypothetical protein